MLTLDAILRTTRHMMSYGVGHHFFDGRNDPRAPRKCEALGPTDSAAAPAAADPSPPKEKA